MKNLKDWLDFSIENQTQLESDHAGLKLPEWNKGYLKALYDVKNIIEENEKEESKRAVGEGIGRMFHRI